MLWLVSEGHDLCLYAGTIPWPDALYLPIVQGRAVKRFTEYSVAGFVGIEGVAGKLLELGLRCIEVGELMMVILPLLYT